MEEKRELHKKILTPKHLSFKAVCLSVFVGILFAGLFSGAVYVLADPPSSAYNPGSTLNPSCAPGSTNCTVTAPVPYTGATTGLNLGSQDFTTTGIITGGTLKVGSAFTFPTSDGSGGQVLTTDGSGNVTWSYAGSGANTALSNLSSVAINAALIPGLPGTLDIGSATLPWANIYFAGTSSNPASNNFEFTGISTSGTRVITFPDASGIIILTTDNLSALSATTSAQLAVVISDETGGGALVFANTPTLISPDLGTPSAVILTNGTGLPIDTGVSGLGTGVATFLGTPSSANLASALTNETGTGVAVFSTSPTLVTPILGNASLTKITNLTTNGFVRTSSSDGTLSVDTTSYIASITDPNADVLFGWDDTDGDYAAINIGSNLSYDHSTHTLSATGGGGGGTWGSITGTLSDQTDLQSALDAKQATLTIGDLTETGSAILTITGGTGAIIGSGLTIQIAQATNIADGYLSSTDWNTFNDKEDALGFTPENVANKSTDTSLGVSDTLYPTQNAVKTYVDTITGGAIWSRSVTTISPTTANDNVDLGSGNFTTTGTGTFGTITDGTLSVTGGDLTTAGNGTFNTATVTTLTDGTLSIT